MGKDIEIEELLSEHQNSNKQTETKEKRGGNEHTTITSATISENKNESSKPKREGTVNKKAAFARSALSKTVTIDTVNHKAEKTIKELQEHVSVQAEISYNEIMFLDTIIFKGEPFAKKYILDVKTHFKPTETFQSTHFSSFHPPGITCVVKKGFSKGEAFRLLRPNSS